MRSLLASSLALTFVGCAASTPPRRDPPSSSIAAATSSTTTSSEAWRDSLEFRLVSTTKQFMTSAVYYDAILPHVVIAYRRLLRDPDAPAIFLALTRSGTPAGKLYGLAGLHACDRRGYEAAVVQLRTSATNVAIQSGCIGDLQPMSEAVAWLFGEERGARDLGGTGRTWRQGGERELVGGWTAADWVRALVRCSELDAGSTLGPGQADFADDVRRRHSDVGATTGRWSVAAERLAVETDRDVDDPRFHGPLAEQRERIVHAIVAIGPRALPELREALHHSDTQVRIGVLRVLEMLGPWASPAADDVARLLDDGAPRMRWIAASVLVELDLRPNGGATAALLRVLARPDEDERILRQAALALCGESMEATSAVPVLLGLADHGWGEGSLSAQALGLIAELGPAAIDALPVLLERLRRIDDRWVTRETIAALGPRVAPGLAMAIADLPLERAQSVLLEIATLPPGASEALEAALEATGLRTLPRDPAQRAEALAAAMEVPALRPLAQALLVRDGPSSMRALVPLLGHEGAPAELTLSALRVPGIVALGSARGLEADSLLRGGLRSLLRDAAEEELLVLLRWAREQDALPGVYLGAIKERAYQWSTRFPSQACFDVLIELLARVGEPGHELLQRLATSRGVSDATRARARAALETVR